MTRAETLPMYINSTKWRSHSQAGLVLANLESPSNSVRVRKVSHRALFHPFVIDFGNLEFIFSLSIKIKCKKHVSSERHTTIQSDVYPHITLLILEPFCCVLITGLFFDA